MSSKNKEEILKELKLAYKKSSQLEDKPDKLQMLNDLYTKVKELDDDKDIHNFLWANRELPLQDFTNNDFKFMPKVAGIWNGNADLDKVDYDKDFGKNWYNEFENIPTSKIQFIADKYGRDWKEMLHDMSNEATQRRRSDIAGESIITDIVAPRSVEAVARGESPSPTDVIGDVASNLLYAVPWARGAQALSAGTKFAKVATNPVIQGVMSNALTPTVTEAYDAVAYDDDARGKFDPKDVAAGTGVNLVGGQLIRGAGMGISRVLPSVGKKLNELGTGQTSKEIADEMSSKFKNFKLSDATNANAPADVRKFAQEMQALQKDNPELYQLVAGKNAPAWEIAAQPGGTAEDKVKSWLAKQPDLNNYTIVTGSGDRISANTPEELYRLAESVDPSLTEPTLNKFIDREYVHKPVTTKFMNNYDKMNIGNTENAKSIKQLISEEAGKNYITNQFGNIQDEQGKAITRIPVVGSYAQRYLDKLEKEAEEERKLKEINDRWQIRLRRDR